MNRGHSDMEPAQAYQGDRLEAICREFQYKVSYDFKRLVFLVPCQGNVFLEQKLHEIYNTNGYQAHKISFHGDMPSHIHIRYENEAMAVEAIQRLTQTSEMEGGRVLASKVFDLLVSIYATETVTKHFPTWTLTLVDIEGKVEHTNPLSKDMVRLLLQKFGEPHIYTYSTGPNPSNHVQALFSSMAEALGASIAHGKWMKMEEAESPRFRYRVRLIGSDKEREVMKRFSQSAAIFEMDYFVGNDLRDYPSPVPHMPPSQQFNPPVPPFHQPRPRRTFNKSREGEYPLQKQQHYLRPQYRPYLRNAGRQIPNPAPVVADQGNAAQPENIPN